jgi:hypothetical protein
MLKIDETHVRAIKYFKPHLVQTTALSATYSSEMKQAAS